MEGRDSRLVRALAVVALVQGGAFLMGTGIALGSAIRVHQSSQSRPQTVVAPPGQAVDSGRVLTPVRKARWSTPCVASRYSEPQRTAWSQWFNPRKLTAAHRTLKHNARIEVKNLANGRRVKVRIVDRGPYVHGRCLDLSSAAMSAIGGDGLPLVVYRVRP